MRLDIITCLPQLLEGHFSASIVKRALERGRAHIVLHNLRDYAVGKHRQVDDAMYGGGAGMVLMIEPIARCIEHLQTQRSYDQVIYMAPDGELLTQPMANALSLQTNLIVLCGRYKGVDERIRTHLITKEISIGNYVISGGELAAAVLVDALIRLLPDVLSDETSALTDSFQDALVAPPAYTRPACFRGWSVPEVLLSGHEQRIRSWRAEESLQRTAQRRPDIEE